MIGDAFGNFEVIAKLGKGGMGVVLLAQHPRIARRAAIKVLAAELTRDPDAVKRFLAEARATSLIRHPGIVEVFDCGVDAQGRAYIVMEYLQGETLAAHMDRVGRLPWPQACDFARQIALAVGAAHAHRIIHRDLKPENVFLVATDPKAPADLTVKVLDFGIAKLLSPESSAAGRPESLTLEGVLLGTPRYISPEQCQAASDVDHRTDVYSLGCILFEMISGEAMFPLDQVHALIAAHLYRPAPAASSLVPEVPPWLDGLIARMVAKRPAERPATMAEVASALASAGRATTQLAADAAGRTSTPLTLILPPSGPTTTSRMRERLRHRLVLVAGAALIIGLLAALLLPRLSGSGETPDLESESPTATARSGAASRPAAAPSPEAAPAPAPAAAPTPAIAPAPSPAAAPAPTPSSVQMAALPARDAAAASSSAAAPAPVPTPAARVPSPRRRASLSTPVPKAPEKRAPAVAPKETDDGITNL